MATKIIKALVDGIIQDIEVEDIVSPEQPLSIEERVDTLEDKHEVVITDGNLLVGNGTTDLEEITPEEVLEHINGASVTTMTIDEYEALGENFNANTLYAITDDEVEDNNTTYTLSKSGASIILTGSDDSVSSVEESSTVATDDGNGNVTLESTAGITGISDEIKQEIINATIASLTTETLTFTLDDGTTVTKEVVVK